MKKQQQPVTLARAWDEFLRDLKWFRTANPFPLSYTILCFFTFLDRLVEDPPAKQTKNHNQQPNPDTRFFGYRR